MFGKLILIFVLGGGGAFFFLVLSAIVWFSVVLPTIAFACRVEIEMKPSARVIAKALQNIFFIIPPKNKKCIFKF